MSKIMKIGLLSLGATVVSAAASAQEYRWDMTMIGVTPELHAQTGKTGASSPENNVVIGIFDGRADRNHSDFEGRVTNIDNLYSGSYTKFSLHGTHVSGTAGAGDNGTGIAGVAPDAKINSYAVFDDTTWRATDLGRKAFQHAQAAGVDVVNMSYGPSVGGGDAFLTGELNIFDDYQNDMVLVRAAGNSGVSVKAEYYAGDASANLGHLLIVGSVDSNKKPAFPE